MELVVHKLHIDEQGITENHLNSDLAVFKKLY